MMKRLALMTLLSLATSAHAESAPEDWKAKCKSCHGEDGRAKTKMGEKESIADLSQPAWQKAWSDAAIRQVIAEGSPKNTRMKPFKEKLTPQQIDALVGYIRTMKAK
jgi:mono/diheme cytochrome c family protein